MTPVAKSTWPWRSTLPPEIVSPVVEGSVRARQDRRNDTVGDKVLPISIHGDAAFAGQGVVMETFQMSQTRGFKTGGTVHIVINNRLASPSPTRWTRAPPSTPPTSPR